MTSSSKILLIGGGGTLGTSIIKSKYFKNLDSPRKNNLNLLSSSSIEKFLKKKYNLIINCAAVARMKECEKNPLKAIKVNIFGTSNLVNEIIKYEKKFKKKIKLIHISTDGVYPSKKGNYSESDIPLPILVYGKQKLKIEKKIKLLTDNYCIIRLPKTYGLRDNVFGFFK